MKRNRSKIRLFIVLILTVIVATNALAQLQENPEEETPSAHHHERRLTMKVRCVALKLLPSLRCRLQRFIAM